MKKTYINPNIVVVRLNTSNIITKMKKTYISPTLVVVRLTPVSVFMTSRLGLNCDAAMALGSGELLVKEESSVSDVNVWDDEW